MSKDKGSGPILNVGIDGRGAESGADQADRAFKKIKKGAKTTDKALSKTQKRVDATKKSFRQMASSIAVVDGPLGGVASRFNAFGTLIGRVNPKMIAFAVGAIAIGAALRSSIGSFIPYEKGMARLESVLLATGRASEISADQIDDFAIRLGKDTLTSRQAVIDATAALATFDNIGTASFERVLTKAQDLSAVFGGDLKSNTQLLARALQSPAEAFTVLERKVGKFTDTEKRLLKALVDTGQVAVAQEVIFAKLAATQGAAEAEAKTFAGTLDTLGEDATNLGIQFVKTFKIIEIAQFIVKSFSVVFSGLSNIFKALPDFIVIVARSFVALAVTLKNKVVNVFDEVRDSMANFIDAFGLGTIGLANKLGIVSDEMLELATQEVISRKQQREVEKFTDTLILDVIPALGGVAKEQTKVAIASQQGSKFIKGMTDNLKDLELQAERAKFGGVTEEAAKFREELDKIAQTQAFELKTFGISGTNLELAELQQKIQMNKGAFDELGESGKTTFEKIKQDIIAVGELQKRQDLTKPIDDYVKASEFGLKQVNEAIVRSGETALDALTRPYAEGERAAERWKGVMASILRDVAKEIIRTQIIARAVGFLGGIASGFGGGGGATSGTSSAPVPVLRPSAMGNAFNNGKIIPHAKGGVVDQLSAFPMAGGNIGTIAEGNKPEAILPLKRTSSGELGVISSGGGGGGTVINNNINVNVDNSGSGNSPQDDENLGRRVAKQIEAKIQQEMTKFVVRQSKSGGILTSGGALA